MTEAENTTDNFFVAHRGLIIGLGIVLIVAALGTVAALIVRDTLSKKAVAELEAFVTRFADLEGSFDAAEGEDKAADVSALLTELTAFADKTGGYAGARAVSMAGTIHARRKAWEAAGQAYLKAAAKAGKTHLAPVALFNAAVCAEEAGKPDEARLHWAKSLTYTDFPLAARSQFSIARVLDEAGKTDEALAAYRLLIEKYEKETEWSKLAHTRILALETTAPAAAVVPEPAATEPAAAQ